MSWATVQAPLTYCALPTMLPNSTRPSPPMKHVKTKPASKQALRRTSNPTKSSGNIGGKQTAGAPSASRVRAGRAGEPTSVPGLRVAKLLGTAPRPGGLCFVIKLALYQPFTHGIKGARVWPSSSSLHESGRRAEIPDVAPGGRRRNVTLADMTLPSHRQQGETGAITYGKRPQTVDINKPGTTSLQSPRC